MFRSIFDFLIIVGGFDFSHLIPRVVGCHWLVPRGISFAV